MDIQAEKLILIEQLLKLQDAHIINRVKELLQNVPKEKIAGSDHNGQMITQSDLIARAAASDRAIEAGDIIPLSIVCNEGV